MKVYEMWIWFGLAVLALIAELATGTFYLLLVAVGLGASGVAAVSGAALMTQLVVCGASILVGLLLLRVLGVLKKRKEDVAGNVEVNLDIGQIVIVDDWAGKWHARTWYRGASWQVELATGCSPIPGEQIIVAVQGSQLIVAPRQINVVSR